MDNSGLVLVELDTVARITDLTNAPQRLGDLGDLERGVDGDIATLHVESDLTLVWDALPVRSDETRPQLASRTFLYDVARSLRLVDDVVCRARV